MFAFWFVHRLVKQAYTSFTISWSSYTSSFALDPFSRLILFPALDLSWTAFWVGAFFFGQRNPLPRYGRTPPPPPLPTRVGLALGYWASWQVLVACVGRPAISAIVSNSVDFSSFPPAVSLSSVYIGLLELQLYLAHGYAWMAVWTELLSSLFPASPLPLDAPKLEVALRTKLSAYSDATARWDDLQLELTQAHPPTELLPLLSDLAPLCSELRDHSTDARLSELAYYWRYSQYHGSSTDQARLSALAALASLAEEALSSRRPSSDIPIMSNSHLRAHCVASIAWYFLPVLSFVPPLRQAVLATKNRLGRPLSRRIFRQWTVNNPLLRLFPPPLGPPTSYSPPPNLSSDPLFLALQAALSPVLDAVRTLEADGIKVDLEALLLAFLRAETARVEAVEAEDKALEAVLDAVICWKGWREEQARKVVAGSGGKEG
ncbi:hypothetical protein JCM8097_000586 [Rhodosporidiobolus ruineniae]